MEAPRHSVRDANELDINTAADARMNRAAAITNAARGAEKLWAGTVVIHPRAKTGAHHTAVESVIYVVSGRARMRRGDKLEFRRRGRAGRLHLRPPYVPTRKSTRATIKPLSCVLVGAARNRGGNLDIPVVESLRGALGDNIHPGRKGR